MQKETIK